MAASPPKLPPFAQFQKTKIRPENEAKMVRKTLIARANRKTVEQASLDVETAEKNRAAKDAINLARSKQNIDELTDFKSQALQGEFKSTDFIVRLYPAGEPDKVVEFNAAHLAYSSLIFKDVLAPALESGDPSSEPIDVVANFSTLQTVKKIVELNYCKNDIPTFEETHVVLKHSNTNLDEKIPVMVKCNAVLEKYRSILEDSDMADMFMFSNFANSEDINNLYHIYFLALCGDGDRVSSDPLLSLEHGKMTDAELQAKLERLTASLTSTPSL